MGSSGILFDSSCFRSRILSFFADFALSKTVDTFSKLTKDVQEAVSVLMTT